jgi:PAS domain S-box-containing protein
MAAPRVLKNVLKKVEDLRFSPEDYISAAMKASIDGIAIINIDTTYRFVNEAYAKIYGYGSPDELIGRSWHLLHPSEEVLRIRDVVTPISRRERHWKGESTGLRKDGSRFPQEVSITQISSSDEAGVMSVVRDITVRKQLEERALLCSSISKILMESMDYEEILKRCANLSIPSFADACVITLGDRSGLIEKVAVGANRELSIFSSLLADLPFKISQKHCHKHVLDTQSLEFIRHVTPEILAGLFPDPALRQEFEDLEIVSYIVTPLCVRNRFLGAVGFFRTKWRDPSFFQDHFDEHDVELAQDLTVRMALAVDNASLLRETQSAVSAREDLMASVSHDLKSPLSSISVSAEMINRIAQGNSESAKFIKLSEAIRVSVDRMMTLIRELLEIEKIRGGTVSVERKLIRADELIEGALLVFESLAKQKGIQVVQNFPSRPIWFHGDRDRLLQAFSNLLANSLKFTPGGGTIRISAELLDREVRFAVSDTGQGINKEDLPRIFDRYYQAKAGLKKPFHYEGTGLGLAITRAIVEAHGGSIWAQSKPGVGSRFSFTIPI